jgi:hypothetical protein
MPDASNGRRGITNARRIERGVSIRLVTNQAIRRRFIPAEFIAELAQARAIDAQVL